MSATRTGGMRGVVLGGLRTQLPRLVAAMVAVGIGVAFATAVLTVRSSAQHAVTQRLGAEYAGADVVVADGFEKTTAGTAATTPGVTGTLTRSAAFLTIAGAQEADLIVGVPQRTGSGFPGPVVTTGVVPTKADELALSPGTAAKLHVGVGSTVVTHDPDGPTSTWRVTGILAPDDVAEGGAGAIAGSASTRLPFLTPTAVLVRGHGSAAELRDAVAARLGPDTLVQTHDERIAAEARSATAGVDVLGALFGGFVVIALFVSALVIANTFTIVLAQRSRDLALLRCVGGGRRQVFGAVLLEAVVTGVLGSIAGVLAGLGLVRAGIAAAARWHANLPAVSVHPNLIALIGPLLLGIVVTTLAAAAPARRATRVAPLAALRPDVETSVRRRSGVVRLVLSSVLLVLGAGLLVMALHGPVPVGVAGGLLSFAGVLGLSVWLLPAVLRVLTWPLARLGGPTGRISVANALRNPRRTASTATALVIGVTLVTTMTTGIASVRASYAVGLDQRYPVDVVASHGVDATAAARLAHVRGVAAVATTTTATVGVGSQQLTTIGVDPTAAGRVLRANAAALHPGAALISPAQARRSTRSGELNGDRLTLVGHGRSITVTVTEAAGVGSLVLASTDLAQVGGPGSTGAWLRASDGVDAATLLTAVGAIVPVDSDGGGLSQRAEYDKIFRILTLVALGLLAFSVLIALIGIGNTLALSVLERRRENGLLRALGLTRGQIRGLLGVEALGLAVSALVTGVVLGLVYARVGTVSLMRGLVAHPVVALPWGVLAAVAGIAIAAALLASVLPARRALRDTPAATLVAE